MLFYFGFGIILAICGYYDYKKNKIPDLITAIAWLYFSFFGAILLKELAFAVFSLLFFINTVKHVIGWADVLLIPLWIAALIIGFPITGMVGLLCFCVFMWKSKISEESPLLHKMAICYWLVIILNIGLRIIP